jgi:hypothetical protein
MFCLVGDAWIHKTTLYDLFAELWQLKTGVTSIHECERLFFEVESRNCLVDCFIGK